MPGHRRVKDVGYDDDDIDEYYSDEEGEYAAGGGGGDEYTAEDKENFATLTPVVKAELQEAGLQASDREVEDALWNYYWDVGKSVNYLKNAKQPKSQPVKAAPKEKAKSKFDEAQERSAAKTGDCSPPLDLSMSGRDWFANVPWTGVPKNVEGELVPAIPPRPMPKLLGGSSKLAKLAEERRKKAEAAKQEPAEAETKKAASALDRLTLGSSTGQKENQQPPNQAEPRKYPSRKRREPTPPPKAPEPEPEIEEHEELPDLKASPTDFGRTLLRSSTCGSLSAQMNLQDLLGSSTRMDAFKDPSPDDRVSHAQSGSKGLSK